MKLSNTERLLLFTFCVTYVDLNHCTLIKEKDIIKFTGFKLHNVSLQDIYECYGVRLNNPWWHIFNINNIKRVTLPDVQPVPFWLHSDSYLFFFTQLHLRHWTTHTLRREDLTNTLLLIQPQQIHFSLGFIIINVTNFPTTFVQFKTKWTSHHPAEEKNKMLKNKTFQVPWDIQGLEQLSQQSLSS